MIARIIRTALEILNGKTGIKWEKDYMGHLDAKFDDEEVESFFDLDDGTLNRVASVCTLGAIELAARQLRLERSDFEKAANFVAKVGTSLELRGLEYADESSEPRYAIPNFNDDEETTQDEVTSLLRTALRKAQEEEALAPA